MKHNKLSIILLAVFLSTITLHAQSIAPGKGNWSKGPAERFTGDVWVEYFFNDSTSDFLSSRVLFSLGARSNWHVHKGRQIIFAIEGTGIYQEKGKPVRVLQKGDVVIIEGGTIHSHGASATRSFTQSVTMNGITGKDATIWMDRVTAADLE